MKPRVLCVDDDPAVLEGLSLGLQRTASVETATCVAEALTRLSDERPYWVVISDMHLPGMNGSQLLSLLKKRSPSTQRILLTGAANLELALTAINTGEVYRFLVKPCPQELLRESVAAAANNYAQRATERDASDSASRGILQTLLDFCTDFDKRAATRALRLRGRLLAVSGALGCQTKELEFAVLSYGLLRSLAIGERPRELVQALLVRIIQTSTPLRSAVALLREANPTLFEGIDLPPLVATKEPTDEQSVAVLRAVCELDEIELTTPNQDAALARMLRLGAPYTKQLVQALRTALMATRDAQPLPLIALNSGMLIANDIRTK